MKKYYIKAVMAVCLMSMMFYYGVEHVSAATPVTPVVQVRTYDAIHGKYPRALWRGSASIINNKGVLLTNNHVVEDLSEENAAGYLICMTLVQGTKPDCNYTARLIARNPKMDIALLQLDAKDILGNNVDFAALPVLDIDYTYVPQDTAVVKAIGYPGIGGETLTTTQGTVAGTKDYNGYTYIKTDTTISHGNSGGPMVSVEGKLVGVNTFGNSDDGGGLGYALLIREAKDFIEANVSKAPIAQLYSMNLASYTQQLDSVNKVGVLQLPWVTYTLPTTYKLKNKVLDMTFTLESKQERDVEAGYFTVGALPTPTLVDDKAFQYYLNKMGLYDKDYHKLITETIGGLKMYRIVYKSDSTNGDTDETYLYLGQLNKNTIVYIGMYMYGLTDSKIAEVKKEKDALLAGLVFEKNSSYIPVTDGKIDDPVITFKTPHIWVGDIIGDLGNNLSAFNWFSEGAISNVYAYQGNLHDAVQVTIGTVTKATSIEKIYKNELANIAKDKKALGTYQGKPAFIICNDKGDSDWYSSSLDENNKPLQQYSCTMATIITGPQKIPYLVVFTIKGPRNTKDISLDKMLQFIQKEVIVGQGSTNIPNVFKATNTFTYTDLKDQTEAYKKKIKTLLSYNLLQKTSTFAPYTPVTYGLLLEKYLYWVHNIDIRNTDCKDVICMIQNKQVKVNGKQVSLATLLQKVPIDWKGYVDEFDVDTFLFYVRLQLAGVELPSYSEYDLHVIQQNDENPEYDWIYKKLQDYDAKIYGARKVEYMDVVDDSGSWSSYFVPTKTIYYSPKKGVWTTPVYKTSQLSFKGNNSNPVEGITTYEQCILVKSLISCAVEYFYDDATITVLSKGDMIDKLVDMMDFGFFDKDLAKKKEVQIEDTGKGDEDIGSLMDYLDK